MSKSVNVSVRLSPETHEALKARAEAERRPLAGMLAIILDDAARPTPRTLATNTADEAMRSVNQSQLDSIIDREVAPRFKQAHKVAAKVLDQ